MWKKTTDWYKKRKKLVAKLIDNPARDDLDEWKTSIDATLRLPRHSWLFKDVDGAAPAEGEMLAPPQRIPGFSKQERDMLDARLGNNWQFWIDVSANSSMGRTANEFIMAPFPKNRFKEMAGLLLRAVFNTQNRLKNIEEIEAEDPSFLMRMQLEYYNLCAKTPRFETENIDTIGEFVADTETTARARERLIWEVPAHVQQVPNWPVSGAFLPVEVYGPDFIRCPVWKNSNARQHLEKGARFKYDEDHGGFKAADTERYNLTSDEYVDVRMSWPMGVTQHFECYCSALKGDHEQTIYVPGEQLRKPTAEEKKATDFFDLAEVIDLADDDDETDLIEASADESTVVADESLEPLRYTTPSRHSRSSRSMSRESFSGRESVGSYYPPSITQPAFSRASSPSVPHVGLLPVHSPERAARAEVPPAAHNIVDDSESEG